MDYEQDFTTEVMAIFDEPCYKNPEETFALI
jgi:hypothetical protein